MKPSLNNVWGREINNQLRRFLNMPPLQDHDRGLLNLGIGEDEYLLALEPADAEDVALLSVQEIDRSPWQSLDRAGIPSAKTAAPALRKEPDVVEPPAPSTCALQQAART